MHSPKYRVGDQLWPAGPDLTNEAMLTVSEVAWVGDHYQVVLRARDGVDFARFREDEVAQYTVRLAGPISAGRGGAHA